MEACVAGFDDIKPGDKIEWKYAKEAQEDTRSRAAHPSATSSGSSSTSSTSTSIPKETGSPGQDSSDDSESGGGESGDSGGRSLGNTHRPDLGLAVVVTLVVGILFSGGMGMFIL